MSIVTRTGDKGTTGLVGGKRVPKTDPRIEAVGTVDELNALLGVVRCEQLPKDAETALEEIQHRLFTLGADIASPAGTKAHTERIQPAHILALDAWIDRMEPQLPPLMNFILPSGNAAGAHLHHARTVCRRAERRVVALSQVEEVNPEVIVFLNRLSDLLFVAARAANAASGVPEETVKYE
jgi:cob(I)alamin adenosyltransferase